MKSILFLVFLIFLKQIHSESDKNACPTIEENIIKSEKELIKIIEDNMHHLKVNSATCIDLLIKSGKFNVLDFYLSELSKRNIKYKESLDMSINTLKKTLDDIINKYRFAEIEYQIVKPAFQWAQSLKEVFLEIKFAHRLDAPGCLEMKNLKVDIKNKEVNLVGYCVLGDVPMKMDFHIDLFRGINVTNCTHHPDSVGRYKITLEKKKESYWKQLLKEGSEAPNNMKVWFQMKEKYDEELKPYVEEQEFKDFNDELRKMGLKPLKKPKKKKDKKDEGNKNETKSDNQVENKTENNTDSKNDNKTDNQEKDKKKDL